jgi:hypothetical protein
MTKTIENLFVLSSAFSDLVIVIFFFIYFGKTRLEKGLWAVLVYCLSSILLNFVGDDLLNPIYKYIFYAFFTLFEYLLFSVFLWLCIKSSGFKKIIVLSSALFFCFVVSYLVFAKHQKIDSLSIGIETILIILFSFYYLYEQLNNTDSLFIYSKYQFWIVTGILIYLTGSFFIYIFANQIDDKFINNYWVLTNVFYIIKNIFFAVSILTYIRKPSKPYTPQIIRTI